MDGGRLRRPPFIRYLYNISKMHTKTIQKIQKAYIKTYEKDVKIYKDIENSQGQGAFFFENTGRLGGSGPRLGQVDLIQC